MRSHGWLAVALATGLSACSGAGNGATTLPPAPAPPATSVTIAPQTSTGALPQDAQVRDIQCHVAPAPGPGGNTGNGGGGGNDHGGGGSPWSGGPGQQVHVYPATLTMPACATRPALFDAFENFEGEVTAYSENPAVATVGPNGQLNHVVPTFGGIKNAWFDVRAQGPGTTRIVVLDKKGNRAYVTVTVTPCPTALPTPVPTLPPLPPPPPPTTAPCSAGRQALGTRQTATGGSGPGCSSSPTPTPTPGG